MTKHLSRRQFLKATAAGGLAYSLAPLFGTNARSAIARPSVPERVLEAATAASPFTALPSDLPLGAPLGDISMGADGSVWGVDTNGVPYAFDQLAKTWHINAPSFDAITYLSRWKGVSASGGSKFAQAAAVVGDQITSPVDGAPLALKDAFTNLPASFQLGLDGIAEVNQQLYLFRNGRFVVVDTSTNTNAVVGEPVALSSLTDWPTNEPWNTGTFQALGSCSDDGNWSVVQLFNNNRVLVVDLVQRKVTLQITYGEFSRGPFSKQMKQGFSALVFAKAGWPKRMYQGPVAWTSTNSSVGDATASYANEAQAANWTPTLRQAPTGRVGALWAASTSNRPLIHDGTRWQAAPYNPAFQACPAVAAGADGSVFCLTSDNKTWGLRQFQKDGTWTTALLAQTSARLVQLEVGDATRVWARDTADKVYRYENGSFTQVSSIAKATDIAANPDGTLWKADGNANAYRFISEGTAAATAVSVGNVGTVTNVASNGFGSALVLARHPTELAANGSPATRLYSYDSLYVWKTSGVQEPLFDYQGLGQSLVVAGHTVFVASQPRNVTTVTALDAQTGQQLWPAPYTVKTAPNSNALYIAGAIDTTLTYDPALNLVYISGGQYLVALDAATGQQVWEWSRTTTSGLTVFGPATLAGNLLCVTDRWQGQLVLIDTVASRAKKSAVRLWATSIPYSLPDDPTWPRQFQAMGAPTFDGDNDVVYLVSQSPGKTVDVNAFTLSTGKHLWHHKVSASALGGVFPLPLASKPVLDCLLGRVMVTKPKPNHAITRPALFVNAGTTIYAVDTEAHTTLYTFTLPQPPSGSELKTTSAMSYGRDQLFFGDTKGALYVLNALTLKQTVKTADAWKSEWQGVLSRPALIASSDPKEGVAVAFARGDANVWLFDPSKGSLASVATDETRIGAVLYDTSHGLLYACSWGGGKVPNPSLGQVFALRPDKALQNNRDFIIESQLMQDYDSDTEAAANGVARYQTHVSVVDANKAPQPMTSVKLWADQENTTVSIDGTNYTIGSTTPALFTTDGTGSFTVISDASDLSTVTLRLWAAFMDPNERITITPDAEFHRRMAATSATGNNDPRQIDLLSAQSYDGKSLFGTSEKSTAQQVAQAITIMLGSVGVGSSTLQGTNTPPKYTAYTTLPGMAYSPANVAADRALDPTTPGAVSLDGSGVSTSVTPAQAAALIDAMGGDQSAIVVTGLLSKLKSAWKEIKDTGARVTQVVVSVAHDVYVGIQYVVNGITKVVKAIAADVADALATIGSFLAQLGKKLLTVLEALGLLLHLNEVSNTAKIIQSQYDKALTTLQTTANKGKKTVDDFFLGAETTIKSEFCRLFQTLGLPQGPGCPKSLDVDAGSDPTLAATSGPALSGWSNMGATPTTVYGQSGANSVQCGWSSHKLRINMKNVTATPSATDAAQGGNLDELMKAFVSSLTTNGPLKTAYEDVGSAFSVTFKATSANEFFAMAVEDVLLLAQAMVITGVAIVKALADTVLAAVDTIIGAVRSMGNAHIPIFSALWKKITGNDLSFLDLVSFVIAFPVTLLYRAIDGHYPTSASNLDLAATATAASQVITNILNCVSVVGALVNGATNAADDTATVLGKEGELSKKITYIELAVQLAYALSYITNEINDPSQIDGVGLALINIVSFGVMLGMGNQPEVQSFITSLENVLAIVFMSIHARKQGYEPGVLAANILVDIPSVINPIKFARVPIGFISPAADVLCQAAGGYTQLAYTIKGWHGTGASEAPREYLAFLPSVAS